MNEPRTCVRCGKPILEEHRRKFCSDACADSAGRERMKMRRYGIRTFGRYRVYPRGQA